MWRSRLLLLTILSPAALAAQATWVVAPAPILRLPATTDDGRVIFGNANWATRLGSGDIALADGAEARVRIIGPDGAERRSFGREGRGPGEFLALAWIGRCGSDSLHAFDSRLARMSVLDATEGHARDWTHVDVRGATETRCSSRGEFAFPVRFRRGQHSRPFVSGTSTLGQPYRVYRDTFDLQVHDAGGDVRGAVDAGVRREIIVGPLPDGRMAFLFRPLGVTTHWAFAGELLAIAFSDSGLVQLHDATGVQRGSFRLPMGSRDASAADQEAALQGSLRATPAALQQTHERFMRSVPALDRVPAFSAMHADPTGLLWFVVSAPGAPRTQLVAYTAAGTATAQLELPVSLAVFEIGADHVLGRVENADGEQSIVAYRFARR